MKEAVVLVHGVWSNGVDLWRLRHRLKQSGYEVHSFNYHVWSQAPADLAQRLKLQVEHIVAPRVHFVGHSYGGIILLHLFEQFPFISKGRVVLLGCPVNGSTVSRRLVRTPLTRWLLGKSRQRGLLGDAPEWKGWQDLGVIAGTFPLGIGMVAGGPAEAPHDGTVAVSETQLRGADDFITLPVSHSGMLMSPQVAHEVVTFLRTGHFDQDTVTPLLNSSVA
jgi:pimeloyl-ACP methyl ester carboxylesterase